MRGCIAGCNYNPLESQTENADRISADLKSNKRTVGSYIFQYTKDTSNAQQHRIYVGKKRLKRLREYQTNYESVTPESIAEREELCKKVRQIIESPDTKLTQLQRKLLSELGDGLTFSEIIEKNEVSRQCIYERAQIIKSKICSRLKQYFEQMHQD